MAARYKLSHKISQRKVIQIASIALNKSQEKNIIELKVWSLSSALKAQKIASSSQSSITAVYLTYASGIENLIVIQSIIQNISPENIQCIDV